MPESPDLRAIADQLAPPNPALAARIAALHQALRAEATAAGQPIDESALLLEALRRAADEAAP